MDNHPALVLKRKKEKEAEEIHQQFDEFYNKYPKLKALLYFFIPVRNLKYYLNDLCLELPFERMRLIGKFTNRNTLKDLHKNDEIELCLEALESVPHIDTFLEVFGSVVTVTQKRKFMMHFFAEVSELEAEESKEDLLRKQKKYYI